MKVKIVQPFAEGGSGAFRTNEVLTVPDDIARKWISCSFAVEITDTPANKPQERAVRKPKETR